MQSFQTSIPLDSGRPIALVQNNATDLLTEIRQSRCPAAIDQIARNLWTQWGEGLLADHVAESLIEHIAAHKKTLQNKDFVNPWRSGAAASLQTPRRLSRFPVKPRRFVSPDRRASLERRRRLAASGPMPPAIASRFTTGELATLRIVADEIRVKGACRLSMGEIAARAGVGQTTARNALRQAHRQGLVLIEERRRYLQPNLPNVVRIVARAWLVWIKRPSPRPSKGGGFKKSQPTDKQDLKIKANRLALPNYRGDFRKTLV